MLTSEEVDAIAETMPGAEHDSAKLESEEKEKEANSREQTSSATDQVSRTSIASIGQDRKVKIEAVEDSKPR